MCYKKQANALLEVQAQISYKTNEITFLLFSTVSRPQLEYKNQLWVMHTQKDVSQLKKVQSSENDQ